MQQKTHQQDDTTSSPETPDPRIVMYLNPNRAERRKRKSIQRRKQAA